MTGLLPQHWLRQAEADLGDARNALERATEALTSPDKLVITNAPILRHISAQITITALAITAIRHGVEFEAEKPPRSSSR